MQVEDEIIENKAQTKMNELRFQALVNLLAEEGVVTREEVKRELDRLLQDDDK